MASQRRAMIAVCPLRFLWLSACYLTALLWSASAAAAPPTTGDREPQPDQPATGPATKAETDDSVAPAGPLSLAEQALQRELVALGLSPRCERVPGSGLRCRYKARSAPDAREARAMASYDAGTNTVYIHIPDVLRAPAGARNTPAMLERLMELNWQMLIGKFEWNARTGEVRLSAVLNTDSGFDRRALRAVVVALDTSLARFRPQLRALAQTLGD